MVEILDLLGEEVGSDLEPGRTGYFFLSGYQSRLRPHIRPGQYAIDAYRLFPAQVSNGQEGLIVEALRVVAAYSQCWPSFPLQRRSKARDPWSCPSSPETSSQPCEA